MLLVAVKAAEGNPQVKRVLNWTTNLSMSRLTPETISLCVQISQDIKSQIASKDLATGVNVKGYHS